MQALTGLERAIGGESNDPIAATWIPIDMCGGWMAAIGVLAGLYRAEVTGRGQRVTTSLLGAGMVLQSGSYLRDGACVRGPSLDSEQTGYGPGYRLYRAGDGGWLALVLESRESWARLRSHPGFDALPEAYVPRRDGPEHALALEAEAVLEKAFASGPAAVWRAVLGSLGVACAVLESLDRDQFRRAILDDPVNRQLERVACYPTADWGEFEQIGPLLRLGPTPGRGPRLILPGVGEHTASVLSDLGFAADEIDALLAGGSARQLEPTAG